MILSRHNNILFLSLEWIASSTMNLTALIGTKNSLTQKKIEYLTICIGLIIWITQPVNAQFYNGLAIPFGKNKIQYQDDFWQFYQYQNFNVYFNNESEQLANYVALAAELNLNFLQTYLGIDKVEEEKIYFVIYPTQDLATTSNIGNIEDYIGPEKTNYRKVENKIFLYYNGDKQQLDAQIRRGIGKYLLDNLLYKQAFDGRINSAYFVFFPNWYLDGLLNYLATDWDVTAEEQLRKILFKNPKLKVQNLNRVEAGIVGQYSWHFIADKYGRDLVYKIAVMAIKNRNLNTSFLKTIGLKETQFWNMFKAHTLESYVQTPISQHNFIQTPHVVTNKRSNYYHQKTSSDGNYTAYIKEDRSKRKVYLLHHLSKKKQNLFNLGTKVDLFTDETFPILLWHPQQVMLNIFHEKEGALIWSTYQPETAEFFETHLAQFDKVLKAQYSNDGTKLLFVATKHGISGLYLMEVKSRNPKRITKDFFEVYEASFFGNNDEQILFVANRTTDTIGVGGLQNAVYPYQRNLFLLNQVDLTAKGKIPLIRLSNDAVNYRSLNNDANELYFLSNQSGRYNIGKGVLNKDIVSIDTSIHYQYSLAQQIYTDALFSLNDLDIHPHRIDATLDSYQKSLVQIPKDSLVPKHPSMSPLLSKQQLFSDVSVQQSANQSMNLLELKRKMLKDITYVYPDYYVFKEELQLNPKDSKVWIDVHSKKSSKEDNLVYPFTDTAAYLAKKRNYEVEFKTFEAKFDLNNRFLTPGYQIFSSTGGNLIAPLSAFMRMGINDFLEDYSIVGAWRFNDLNNYEVALSFYDDKKRWDKTYLLHRGTFSDLQNNVGVKTHTYNFMHKLVYPFRIVDRVSFTFTARMDEFIPMSFNEVFLTTPSTYRFLAHTKVAYTFDNTRRLGDNLLQGTRFKLFTEAFVNVNSPTRYTYVYGLDVRNYNRVYKKSIWANRLALSAAYGTERLMYYMGGVDQWFLSRFNQNLAPATLPQNQAYAFQSMATNMRGFIQNTRNGTAFIVYNTEFRIPLFTTFYPKPMTNKLLKNLQLICFSDIGMAWTGLNPYDKNSALNIQNYQIGAVNNPVARIRVQTQKNPLLIGYGFGARTKIMNYFIRLDWSRGIADENPTAGKNIYYLSLGYDF